MAKIIPIRDLKDTSKLSEMCHETDAPIFITKNGYSDMVIMSNEAYEKQQNRMESYYKGLLSANGISPSELMNSLLSLSPEDTLDAMLNAQTDDEKFFFEMIGNLLIQIKQKDVIKAGNLY